MCDLLPKCMYIASLSDHVQSPFMESISSYFWWYIIQQKLSHKRATLNNCTIYMCKFFWHGFQFNLRYENIKLL